MSYLKYNVAADAPGMTGVRRRTFDAHLTGCPDCQPTMCATAQTLWRNVVIQAMKDYSPSLGTLR